MRRPFLVVLLATSVMVGTLPACSYSVINSRTEVQNRNPRVLDSNEEYRVDSQSVGGNTLILGLDRSCYEAREVDEDTILVESRERNVGSGYWLGTASVSGIGLLSALTLYTMNDPDFCSDTFDEPDCVPDAESVQDTAGVVTLATVGITAAAIVGGLIYDGGTYEEETLLDRRVVRQQTEPVDCGAWWPQGGAVMLAFGSEYPAHVSGQGRIEVDVTGAPARLWTSDGAIQIELPNSVGLIEFELNESSRQAGLNGANGGGDLTVSLHFEDREGDNDGSLDPGEIATLIWEIRNNSPQTQQGVVIELDGEQVGNSIALERRILVGDVPAGQSRRGRVDISVDAGTRVDTVIIEAEASAASGATARDRMSLALSADSGPTRAYVWFEDDNEYGGLLNAGSVRLQTVLTETGEFVIVADANTRERISRFVDDGGGSAEERLRTAIDAANSENIRQVFQLAVNPISGQTVQLVVSVYQTGTADRIFQRDTAVNVDDGIAVLDAFDRLGRDFVSWRHGDL